MTKMASLELPDNIYNWIDDFFRDRQHCTRYAGQSSSVAAITTSIIQGSGLGPVSYIITAADLHPVTNGNRIVKFADDTYLIVPASYSSCRNRSYPDMGGWKQSDAKLQQIEGESLHEASVESKFNCLRLVSTSNESAA